MPSFSAYPSQVFTKWNTGNDPALWDTARQSWTCQVCGKSFAVPSALQVHYRVHMGERPFSCRVCRQTFNQKQNLKTHMRIHFKPGDNQWNMDLHVTKPVFGVPDKVRFKPACSATETSLKIEISLVASLDMILSKKQIIKALIRLRRCAGWSAPVLFTNPRRQFFLRRGPYEGISSN